MLKAGVADIEQHLSDLEAEASAWAEAKGSGAPVDEARGKLLARETAVAKEELALSIDGLRVGQGAVDKAATAKLTAEWHVAQRDARLACGPQGEAEIKLAEASAAWWSAVRDVQDAVERRHEAQHRAGFLKAHLWGVSQAPAVLSISDGDIRRLVLSLPGAALVAMIDNRAGAIDFAERGRLNVERARAAG